MATPIPTKDLPPDIITDILSRLPLKSVVRFRCVSKPWLYLITYSRFPYRLLNAQLNSLNHLEETCIILSTINHNPERSESKLYFVGGGHHEESFSIATEINFPVLCGESFKIKTGSCDGMICLSLDNDTGLVLCNPATRDCKELPLPVDYGVCGGVCGLGFDSSIDDYKIVSLSRKQIHVFSVKRNLWRNLGDLPYSLFYKGIHINGCIYWAAGKAKFANQILCFDVSNEVFREVSLPPLDHQQEIPKLRLMLTRRRSLCVCIFRENGQTLWVMEEKEKGNCNEEMEKWTRLMTVPKNRNQDHFHFYPKCLTISGKVLVAVKLKKFVMYDPKEQIFEELCIDGLGLGDDLFDKAISYTESLISPGSIRGMNDID